MRFNGSLFTILSETSGAVNKNAFKKELNRLTSKVVGKKVPVRSFVTRIRSALKGFGIPVSMVTSKAVDSNTINANAYFDPHDAAAAAEGVGKDVTGIELELVFHPKDKFLIITAENWEWTMETIASNIVHEYIHQKQTMKRDYGPGRETNIKELKSALPYETVKKAKPRNYSYDDYLEDVEYFASPDEVEAYAYTIANELLLYFKDHSEVVKSLNKYSRIKLKHSPSMDSYVTLFKPGSRVIKRLIKRVLFYLEQLPEFE